MRIASIPSVRIATDCSGSTFAGNSSTQIKVRFDADGNFAHRRAGHARQRVDEVPALFYIRWQRRQEFLLRGQPVVHFFSRTAAPLDVFFVGAPRHAIVGFEEARGQVVQRDVLAQRPVLLLRRGVRRRQAILRAARAGDSACRSEAFPSALSWNTSACERQSSAYSLKRLRDQLYRAVGIGPPIAEPRRDLAGASLFE